MAESQESRRVGNRGRLLILEASLAFILLLLVAAPWLRSQWKWKADRSLALSWMNAQAAFWADLPVDQEPHLDGTAPMKIRFLGAPGLKQVCVVVPSASEVAAKQAELESLFPEAEILVVSPGNGYSGKHAHLVKN